MSAVNSRPTTIIGGTMSSSHAQNAHTGVHPPAPGPFHAHPVSGEGILLNVYHRVPKSVFIGHVIPKLLLYMGLRRYYSLYNRDKGDLLRFLSWYMIKVQARIYIHRGWGSKEWSCIYKSRGGKAVMQYFLKSNIGG